MTQNDAAASELSRLPPMTHYVLGLLRRAPSAPRRSEAEAEVLQERHLGHLRGLRESGELLAVGPIEGDGELRGVLIFSTDRPARAQELMRNDPLVAGGYLLLELHSWFAPAGLGVAHPKTGLPK